ncbi:MAG: DUF433 domain-containing protein [Chitinophagaceae bacterium]|jgi:uncharacterized protein (DUF433 family)|nr:DUF433 domain-containing protein [Chitinophagaceae bacterium]MCU0403769.1 DUF433 domain-containing protein [Chitinophagaceae bacterium]
MQSLLNRITVLPDLCNGKPTIRGKRITVHTVLGHLAAGDSTEDIIEMYPFLEKDDIKAALEYASILADRSFVDIHSNLKLSA